MQPTRIFCAICYTMLSHHLISTCIWDLFGTMISTTLYLYVFLWWQGDRLAAARWWKELLGVFGSLPGRESIDFSGLFKMLKSLKGWVEFRGHLQIRGKLLNWWWWCVFCQSYQPNDHQDSSCWTLAQNPHVAHVMAMLWRNALQLTEPDDRKARTGDIACESLANIAIGTKRIRSRTWKCQDMDTVCHNTWFKCNLLLKHVTKIWVI